METKDFIGWGVTLLAVYLAYYLGCRTKIHAYRNEIKMKILRILEEYEMTLEMLNKDLSQGRNPNQESLHEKANELTSLREEACRLLGFSANDLFDQLEEAHDLYAYAVYLKLDEERGRRHKTLSDVLSDIRREIDDRCPT